jgi:photosystem II stability/assembly factor-like uncharacterized protein
MKYLLLILQFLLIAWLPPLPFSAVGTGGAQSFVWEKIATVTEYPSAILVESDTVMFVGDYAGLLRYDPQARSFIRLQGRKEPDFVMRAILSPRGTLLVATGRNGVVRTNDGGNTWLPSSRGLGRADAVELHRDSFGMIWAGTRVGLFVSTDDGVTWMKAGLSGLTVMAIASDDDGLMLAGTDKGSIYRSVDKGLTWTVMDSSSKAVIQRIVLSSRGVAFAGVPGKGILRSPDRGRNWFLSNYGLSEKRVETMFAAPNGDVFVGTKALGLFRSSDDGETWIHIGGDLRRESPQTSLQMEYDAVRGITVAPDGLLWVATTNGVFRSGDAGHTWTSTPITVRYASSIFFLSDHHILVSALPFGLFTSTDKGDTWTDHGLQLDRYLGVNQIVRDPSGGLLVATNKGLHYSADEGESWHYASYGLPPNHRVLCLLRGRDNELYAGLSEGGLWSSEDNGKSWIKIGHGDNSVRLIAMNSDGVLYAAVADHKDGLFLSRNKGTTWEGAGLSDKRISTVLFDSLGRVIVGTSGYGFFVSDSGHSPWHSRSNGLTSGSILALEIDAAGGIVAGTRDGLFRLAKDADRWIGIGFKGTAVSSLRCFPDGRIYVATESGLYRSTLLTSKSSSQRLKPSKSLWTPLSGPYFCASAWQTTVDREGQIWVLTRSGQILLSRDDGVTWSQASHVDRSLNAILVPHSGSMLIYGNSNLLRSNNAGRTWDTLASIPDAKHVRHIRTDRDGTVWLDNPRSLLFSNDGGNSWRSRHVPEPVRDFIVLEDGEIITGHDFGLLRSRDRGETWRRIATPFHSVTAVSDGPHRTLYVATGQGLFLSRDRGGTWEKLPVNASLDVVSMSVTPTATVIAVGRNGSINRCEIGQSSWQRSHTGIKDFVITSLVAPSDKTIIISTDLGAVCYSEDSGRNWESVEVARSEWGLTRTRLAGVATPTANRWITADFMKIYESSDKGRAWTDWSIPKDYGTIEQIVHTSDGKTYVILERGWQRFYVHDIADLEGVVYRLRNAEYVASIATNQEGDIFVGTNYGLERLSVKSVTKASEFRYKGLIDTTAFYICNIESDIVNTVSAVVVARNNHVWVAKGGGTIFRSRDNGETWQRVGAAAESVRALVVNSRGSLFAATNIGVMHSFDGGTTWTPLSTGLTDLDVRFLTIDQEGFLYAVVGNNEIYRAASSRIELEEE